MPPEVPATVNAGVVVAVPTVIIPPVKLTLVTVPPDPVAESVPAANDTPVPMVTLLNPPAAFPYRIEEPLVAGE
jgi:hypothetical protein